MDNPPYFYVWEDGTGELCITANAGVFATTIRPHMLGNNAVRYDVSYKCEGGYTVEWIDVAFKSSTRLHNELLPAFKRYLALRYGKGGITLRAPETTEEVG